MDKDEVIETIKNLISNIEELSKKNGVVVNKAIDKEKRQVLGAVLIPDRPDLHGDVMNAEEIEKAVHNYNTNPDRMIGIQHETMTSDVWPIESYIAPVDMVIGGQAVPEGTWLMKMQISQAADDLWEKVKSGELGSFSPGGKGVLKPLTEDS